MHFGENQLSPGSIGISPLSTGHPPVLQHWWVRASTGSHPRCTLPMDSSPGFGSHPHDAHALFRLAFAPAPRLSGRLTCQAPVYGPRRADALVGSFYKRHAVTPAAQRPPDGLRLLVGAGFQDLVSSPSRGAFHLSLTVLVPYRWPVVLRLGGWSPQLPTGFLGSRGTQGRWPEPAAVAYGALTPCGAPSQVLRLTRPVDLYSVRLRAARPYNPGGGGPPPVWAVPGSLATTTGISLDSSSSRY